MLNPHLKSTTKTDAPCDDDCDIISSYIRQTDYFVCTTFVFIFMVSTYRQDLVSSAQFSTEVGRPSSQDEGDENAFSIFSSHDVEAQSGGALVEDDLPGLPVHTVQIIHELRVRWAQHLHRWCKHTHDACTHTHTRRRVHTPGSVQNRLLCSRATMADTYWGLLHL